MAHRTFLLALTTACVVSCSITAQSHEPNRKCVPVRQRVDVVGPVGNRLEPSMRRTHNRPTFLSGRLAYIVAPTSQEAMTWHKADHLGAYRNEAGRIEPKYFYPKPWEALKIGPRVSLQPSMEPADLRSLQDVQLSDSVEREDVDELALPDDETESLREDVIGSGVDEDDIRSQSDLMIDKEATE